MALQISYRGVRLGEDLDITVYWFPRDPDRPANYLSDTLGAWRVSMPRDVDVSGTPEEVASWNDAAASFVQRITAEDLKLAKAERHIGRWDSLVTRRRARLRYDDVRASFLEAVRSAAAVYQPVRDVIEARLAEQESHTRELRRRAYQEKERQWMEEAARFREWERRQEVAERPLSGGLSPRQMAARGDGPVNWPPEVRSAVGDPSLWWAGVRASVRNRQASALAVRRVVVAITETAAALEEAGRPDIDTIKGRPQEVLRGWWIHFDWSDMPDTTRLRTPPNVPAGCVEDKDWHYQLYLPSDHIFTVYRSGEFGFAREHGSKIPSGGYGTTYTWIKRNIEQFAEELIHNEIIAFRAPGHQGHQAYPMTDHADPDAYVPYVEAVAERAAANFHALLPDRS
ncbi:hypothetical protein ABZ934_31235 [Streptomyces sp. NPDC046557]|uniref:hypothetical protein n=1 Tax=Streptomyces sp. NPDC046557 TaxID=3155372 RepID=UPI0033D01635